MPVKCPERSGTRAQRGGRAELSAHRRVPKVAAVALTYGMIIIQRSDKERLKYILTLIN